MSNVIAKIEKIGKIEKIDDADPIEESLPIQVGPEDAQALTLMAQRAEQLRYHSEQLHQMADKARQDWLISQQGFERVMYKAKNELGVKPGWVLLRLENGGVAFAPAPPPVKTEK